ncbi:MAG: hypothetical protein JW765_06930 [Deltaproteobacteria bacterium]|nr:hypothetical protein [Candidatus Zymogenaceae bacterium]
MKDRGTGKREIKEKAAEAARPPRGKSPKSADTVIPVCLGEFGIDEAQNFSPLWEATWSQDVRGKVIKK